MEGPEEEDVDLEHLDDTEEDEPQNADSGVGSKDKSQGMGTKVSMMTADEGERDPK